MAEVLTRRAERRLLARSACAIAAFAGAALVSQATQAEPAFAPPLDAPKPLAAAVDLELRPGSRSDCVIHAEVDGAPAAMPEEPITTIVESAPDGLRFLVIDEADGSRIELLIRAGGEISLIDADISAYGLPEEAQSTFLENVGDLYPDLALHGRRLAQGEAVFMGDAMRVAGSFLGSLEPGLSADVEGESIVAGETRVDGRRNVVLSSTFEIVFRFTDMSGEMRMVGDGVDAVDLETGLYRYGAYSAVATLPPEIAQAAGASEMRLGMQIDCEISTTGG